MPNWVTTHVTIKGTPKDLKKIQSLLIDKDTVRFHNILPVPDGLDAHERHEWRWDNWGCKWEGELIDSCITHTTTTDNSELVIYMRTPWNCPFGVLKAIVQKFQDVLLTFGYADEDIGTNCGCGTISYNKETQSLNFENFEKDGDYKFATLIVDPTLKNFHDELRSIISDYVDVFNLDAVRGLLVKTGSDDTLDMIMDEIGVDDLDGVFNFIRANKQA
jgi:hypothetical protein